MHLQEVMSVHYAKGMNTIILFYVGVSFLHLSLRSQGYKTLGDVTKILLMPILILFVLQSGSYPLLVVSLSFATLGDGFLTKGHQGSCFLWGMGAFAVAHSLYALQVLSLDVDWILAGIALASLSVPFGLFTRLIGKQKGRPPYVAYAALFTILAALMIGLQSLLCTLGVLLFIVSDTMIGLDSLNLKHFTNTSEMGSYILAQLLLILGFTAL